jgi:hypothetical protein
MKSVFNRNSNIKKFLKFLDSREAKAFYHF